MSNHSNLPKKSHKIIDSLDQFCTDTGLQVYNINIGERLVVIFEEDTQDGEEKSSDPS